MTAYPDWFSEVFDVALPTEGEDVVWGGRPFVRHAGLLRDTRVFDAGQTQTRDAFGFKWHQVSTYESEAVWNATRSWLVARYGDWSQPEFWAEFGDRPLVLDAGCGSSLTARVLIADALKTIRYVGVDISDAVDVAADALSSAGVPAAFVQSSILDLPFEEGRFDVVLSEGVLHHTPSTEKAIHAVARQLRPGGLLAFYVYRRKSPVREFTDDYIRERISDLPPQEAWDALMPLTRLGQALGELNVTVNVPEDVPLLGIPKGEIDVQRLFYWHVCKMYHRPEYSLDEMNHVNFDWFSPTYSHRQSAEDVRQWCEDAGLEIDRLHEEEAGINVFARRLAKAA